MWIKIQCPFRWKMKLYLRRYNVCNFLFEIFQFRQNYSSRHTSFTRVIVPLKRGRGKKGRTITKRQLFDPHSIGEVVTQIFYPLSLLEHDKYTADNFGWLICMFLTRDFDLSILNEKQLLAFVLISPLVTIIRKSTNRFRWLGFV